MKVRNSYFIFKNKKCISFTLIITIVIIIVSIIIVAITVAIVTTTIVGIAVASTSDIVANLPLPPQLLHLQLCHISTATMSLSDHYHRHHCSHHIISASTTLIPPLRSPLSPTPLSPSQPPRSCLYIQN